jgi:hypothetical protein
MRTIPFTVLTARGIHALLTITFADDTTLMVTTADSDVTIGDNTWSATAAVNITQIQFTADGTPSGADIRLMAMAGSLVPPGRGSFGYFDGLPITVELFDVRNPGSGTINYIPGATIGSVQEDTNGVVVLAVQGPSSIMRGPMTEVYTAVCKARLGDDRCREPLDVPFVQRGTQYQPVDTPGFAATRYSWVRVEGNNDVVYQVTTGGSTDPTTQPTYSVTIGDTVTDGSVVFTVRQARMVRVTGQAIDFYNIQLTSTPSNNPSALGNIIPRSGPLANVKIPIKAYDTGTLIATMAEPYAMSNFPVGTIFDIHRGCDRLLATCRDVFNRLKNMRATPYAPGADVTTGRA